MGRFIGRKRAAALVAGCAVAIGAAVVVVPALADDASVTAPAAVADFDAASAVRLHLGGDDNRYFSYPEGDSTANQRQDLRANGCKLTSSDTIVVPSATSGTASKPVGLVGNGVGVKGSSTSTGTPCGQIDSAEALTLTKGLALGSRLFTGVRLDLEMTGNAVATLTLTKGTGAPPSPRATACRPVGASIQTRPFSRSTQSCPTRSHPVRRTS